ncbi:hypothetical protein E0W60_25985 [Cupriavidus oxalaticus]|uniref:Uncharacterized protein n=2 Tax=Cupriavidus oxalaticus TaxID=96344 RepID=A0A4P7LFR3_9BURK|nr:hypothetical protein E0W60_25985 [Cupriavidus oxalaticus]
MANASKFSNGELQSVMISPWLMTDGPLRSNGGGISPLSMELYRFEKFFNPRSAAGGTPINAPSPDRAPTKDTTP